MADCNSAASCAVVAIEFHAAHEQKRDCLETGYCPIHAYGHASQEDLERAMAQANDYHQGS